MTFRCQASQVKCHHLNPYPHAALSSEKSPISTSSLKSGFTFYFWGKLGFPLKTLNSLQPLGVVASFLSLPGITGLEGGAGVLHAPHCLFETIVPFLLSPLAALGSYHQTTPTPGLLVLVLPCPPYMSWRLQHWVYCLSLLHSPVINLGDFNINMNGPSKLIASSIPQPLYCQASANLAWITYWNSLPKAASPWLAVPPERWGVKGEQLRDWCSGQSERGAGSMKTTDASNKVPEVEKWKADKSWKIRLWYTQIKIYSITKVEVVK